MLIRLSQTPTGCSWARFFCIKFGIGRRSHIASNSKQGAESVEWVKAAIEAEREFVEIGLQGQLGLTPLTVTGIIFVSLIACLAVAWLVRQIEKPYLRLLDISVKYMLKDK